MPNREHRSKQQSRDCGEATQLDEPTKEQLKQDCKQFMRTEKKKKKKSKKKKKVTQEKAKKQIRYF
jgi:hypothetical protein